MTFRWVATYRTILGGREYRQGELWSGEGESPVGKPGWGMIAGKTLPLGAEKKAEGDPGPPPTPDFSSDEAAARTRQAMADWRARGGGQAPPAVHGEKAVDELGQHLPSAPAVREDADDGAALRIAAEPPAPEATRLDSLLVLQDHLARGEVEDAQAILGAMIGEELVKKK